MRQMRLFTLRLADYSERVSKIFNNTLCFPLYFPFVIMTTLKGAYFLAFIDIIC